MATYLQDDKTIDEIKLKVDDLEGAFNRIAESYKGSVDNEAFEKLLTILDQIEYTLVNEATIVSFTEENN